MYQFYLNKKDNGWNIGCEPLQRLLRGSAPSHSMKPPSGCSSTWLDWSTGSLWRAGWGENSQQPSRSSASLRALSQWCAFAKRAKEALGEAKLVSGKTSKQRLNLSEAQRNAHLCQDCPALSLSLLRSFVPFPCSISEQAGGQRDLIKRFATGPVKLWGNCLLRISWLVVWVPLIIPFSNSRDFKLYIYFIWDKKESIAFLACSGNFPP